MLEQHRVSLRVENARAELTGSFQLPAREGSVGYEHRGQPRYVAEDSHAQLLGALFQSIPPPLLFNEAREHDLVADVQRVSVGSLAGQSAQPGTQPSGAGRIRRFHEVEHQLVGQPECGSDGFQLGAFVSRDVTVVESLVCER